MTNYIARTGAQKKKYILRQRELTLCGEIGRAESEERINRSAAKVKLAQLAVLKALIYEKTPVRAEDEEWRKPILEELRSEKQYWQSISKDEIIKIYAEKTQESFAVNRKKH